jgi:hypothetical protein
MTMRQCLALGACVTAAMLGVATTSADASGWRRVAPSTSAFSSDGTRYVAWQVSSGSPIVVLDTRTGHRSQVAAPGCKLFNQGGSEGGSPEEGLRAADARFLVFCASQAEGLLDVRTGLVTTLPAGEDGPVWQVVGSRYIEGWDDKRRCRQTAREIRDEEGCVALYDIATGVVRVRPHSGLADLDRPGAPPVCPRLRAKINEEVPGYNSITDERGGYSNGVYAEGTAPVRISRCRGRPTLVSALGPPHDMQLSARLLTWDTAHPLSDFEDELSNPGFRHGVLESYGLSNGRRRTLTLPALPLVIGGGVVHVVSGYATHTANTVFWIATRKVLSGKLGYQAGGSAVYAARL